MKLNRKIRMYTPELFKKPYRIIRRLQRRMFSNLLNRINSVKYRRLIVNRFPEITFRENTGTVVDLGANVGHFSHACFLLGFNVIAVEPHPIASEYLKKRFRNNPYVEVLSAAIGNSQKSQKLYFHEDHLKDPIQTSISASTVSDKFSNSSESVSVETIAINSLLEAQDKIAILKCDIEGAEYLIIPDIIANATKIERLLLETHRRFMGESSQSEIYNIRMSQLEKFIHDNNLQSTWLTNWV